MHNKKIKLVLQDSDGFVVRCLPLEWHVNEKKLLYRHHSTGF